MNMYSLLGVLVIFIWSTSAPLLKQIILFSNGNYLMVIFAYNIVASIILLFSSLLTKEYKQVRRIRNNKRVVFLVFLNGFYDVFVALAITFSMIVQYAIIANYLWPILLVVLIRMKERVIELKSISGAILGLLSVVIVLLPQQTMSIKSNSLGIGFGIVAAITWASYSFLLQKDDLKISLTIQGFAQHISALFILIVAVLSGKFDMGDLINQKSLILILIYAVFNMAVAYVIWIHVVVGHNAFANFAVGIYLLPILSVAISSIWFRMSFNIRVLLALPLILLGIVISNLKKRGISRSDGGEKSRI